MEKQRTSRMIRWLSALFSSLSSRIFFTAYSRSSRRCLTRNTHPNAPLPILPSSSKSVVYRDSWFCRKKPGLAGGIFGLLGALAVLVALEYSDLITSSRSFCTLHFEPRLMLRCLLSSSSQLLFLSLDSSQELSSSEVSLDRSLTLALPDTRSSSMSWQRLSNVLAQPYRSMSPPNVGMKSLGLCEGLLAAALVDAAEILD
mmetsp:Transcript_15182/g.51196  ORF Transcript_15182/g.51196 Transcript_15182/m.51196 type:complete len:201 (+) Transcript_15182:1134-1736(+)